ncbi:MAG: hypothetical protein C0601_12525 [Candidatus Muiribacterium halophilum]|uniref:Uncharacterized protein n=1 Tax=Muiribacterium halophilum TaxID=2053465 RepID=A0A2N5ZAA7_MUIH1|nr:MAG: hypothetical protein C0601_12525 [Candidatus Muirbacterium halophilum]
MTVDEIRNIKDIEKDIIPLVYEINQIRGIKTIDSCGGHTKKDHLDIRYPFVSFIFSETSIGLDNIALLYNVGKIFGWITKFNGVRYINEDSRLIPSILKQSDVFDRSKIISTYLTFLPFNAVKNPTNTCSNFFADDVEEVVKEKEKIEEIASCIRENNDNRFAFQFRTE